MAVTVMTVKVMLRQAVGGYADDDDDDDDDS